MHRDISINVWLIINATLTDDLPAVLLNDTEVNVMNRDISINIFCKL